MLCRGSYRCYQKVILPPRVLLTIYILLDQTYVMVILSITNQTMIHLAVIESIQYNAALPITGVI